MKKLLTVAIMMGVMGCDDFISNGKWVIYSKTKYDDTCHYSYEYGYLNYQSFDDSCSKYSVGDTIKHY